MTRIKFQLSSRTYVGELALDCAETCSMGDTRRADFVATTGNSCDAGIAACSNDLTSSALDTYTLHMQINSRPYTI